MEDGGEELYDLMTDPLETKNLVFSPDYHTALETMRNLYRRHLKQTDDPFESMQWKADVRWRSHPVGYQNHRGIAAPQEESCPAEETRPKNFVNVPGLPALHQNEDMLV